jgi:hypothetical protein
MEDWVNVLLNVNKVTDEKVGRTGIGSFIPCEPYVPSLKPYQELRDKPQ